MAMVAGLDILPSHWTMDWSLPTQRGLEWVHQSSRTLQKLPDGTIYKKDNARAGERGRVRGNSDASNKDVYDDDDDDDDEDDDDNDGDDNDNNKIISTTAVASYFKM